MKKNAKLFVVFGLILFIVASFTVLSGCEKIFGSKNNNSSTNTPPKDTSTDEHVHKYGEWEIMTEPTCDEEGTKERVCSCGETEMEIIPATGHSFGKWITVIEATDTADGSKKRVCSICGYEETEDIHDYVNDECTYCQKLRNTDGLKFTYNEETQTYAVTKYSGTSDFVRILDTYDDGENGTHSVTSIGGSAFNGCSGLTRVTIPDSVTSIGYGAFSGCSSLESITIPFVGAEAGKTSSDTYQYPFGYIFGTDSYTGGTATKQYYKQYYYDGNTSLPTSTTYYIPSSLKSVTVTGWNILYGAFYNCSGLTNITIPDGVTSIGISAFYGCSGLSSITIPDGVTSIGNSAFKGCSGLTDIYSGDIASWCGISGLGNIMSSSRTLYIGGKKIEGELVIPNSVTSIGDSAFRYCVGITSVTIGSSVTSIGEWAFV